MLHAIPPFVKGRRVYISGAYGLKRSFRSGKRLYIHSKPYTKARRKHRPVEIVDIHHVTVLKKRVAVKKLSRKKKLFSRHKNRMCWYRGRRMTWKRRAAIRRKLRLKYLKRASHRPTPQVIPPSPPLTLHPEPAGQPAPVSPALAPQPGEPPAAPPPAGPAPVNLPPVGAPPAQITAGTEPPPPPLLPDPAITPPAPPLPVAPAVVEAPPVTAEPVAIQPVAPAWEAWESAVAPDPAFVQVLASDSAGVAGPGTDINRVEVDEAAGAVLPPEAITFLAGQVSPPDADLAVPVEGETPEEDSGSSQQ
ncbi:hypothetical protein DCC85_17640 [Paenibacillus sp. CAA11]|uniref:hypothetical protein n=1 Tax=Paenibacillus sp. CAA11 TaxID=1532905 RepID=UPI000D393062|nr:hypothetical protein [Paenibacillus sp. CAA11]AWB45827.1 hypothetical protein DCC85_17640 [Paenibacillus sp. CAA11]